MRRSTGEGKFLHLNIRNFTKVIIYLYTIYVLCKMHFLQPVAKWFCPPCGLRRVTSGNKDGDVIGATVGKGEDQQYCVCSRGYVGRMVGCDNPKCLVEWFHFECVNLTAEVGKV